MKTPIEQYESETGKSVWAEKNRTYTNEYVSWLKNWLKTDNGLASKSVKLFAGKIKTESQSNN